MAWLESRWVVICLIASLAFNVGVGSTFGARIIEHHFGKMHGESHGARHRRFHEQLKLSPEQEKRIQLDVDRVHPQLRQVNDAIDQERADLAELLVARRPDRTAIAAGLERLNELQGQRQQLIVDYMLRFSDLLDDQQRETCRDIIVELLRVHQPDG